MHNNEILQVREIKEMLAINPTNLQPLRIKPTRVEKAMQILSPLKLDQ